MADSEARLSSQYDDQTWPKKRPCNCQSSCRTLSYEIEHSASQWPSPHNWRGVAQSLGLDVPTFNSTTEVDTILERDKVQNYMNQLSKIRIYFKSRNRRVIEMEPEFPSIYSYVVVIGGSLSVYMGFSFVSVLEVLELAYDFFVERGKRYI